MTSRPRRLLGLGLASVLAASLVPLPAAAAPAPRPRQAPAPAAAGSVIVRFADGTLSAPHLAALSSEGADTSTVAPRAGGRALVRVRRGEDAGAVAQRLSRRPGVRWAIPNVVLHASALDVPPNDPYYSTGLGGFPAQRSYLGPVSSFPHSIDLEPAWRQAFAAPDHGIDLLRPGATLALIDTGYTPTGETPPGVFTPVYNYISRNADTSDDEGHGTEVGNIMAASTGNGLGVAGVQYATPAKVLVYKALDSAGNGTTDDVMSAVRSAADNGAKVINLSLGAPGYDSNGVPDAGLQQAWDDTVAYASSKGAIVVAAAGNEGGPVDFPAAAKGAIAVGSIDPATGSRSSFSDFGPQLSLCAPGEGILVYGRNGTMEAGSGTSFSSPMVAASIGLLRSLLPKASPATIASAVLSTCRDLGPAGFDDSFGNGELDVWAAYRKLMAEFPVQPSPSASVSGDPGFSTTIAWPALPGSDVVYHYGLTGGPAHSTTATSATLWLGADGTYTGFVSASASDMFSSAPAAFGFTVATGHPGLTLRRLAGSDRYATAAAVSAAAFPHGAPAVVVASGEGFPDALSASVLAARLGGPLLLAKAGSLPQPTADEIARLKPSRVVIVGGTPSVSDSVRAALARLVPSVARIAGSDRYATSEQVALRVQSLEGGSVPSATVVVASGEKFPDALAASPMAAAAGWPILLTKTASLPSPTARALGEVHARRALVVGGEPTVSSAVAAALPSPVRVAGKDRFATSRAVADWAANAGVLGRGDLGVATGLSFPDALSGGVLMAGLRGAMVLSGGSSADFDAWLRGVGDTCGRLDVFGGDASVPAPLAARVLTALRSP